PRLGTDLSRVRVHTDGRSGEIARSIQAKAFTTGEEVVFAPGEYAPDRPDGQHLIAHELTHVAQQSGRAPSLDWSGDGAPTDSMHVARAHVDSGAGRPRQAATRAPRPQLAYPPTPTLGTPVASVPRPRAGGTLARPSDDDSPPSSDGAERQA